MTPEQALQMLDQAVATMTLDRNQHANLQQAISCLAQKITTPVPAIPAVPVKGAKKGK